MLASRDVPSRLASPRYIRDAARAGSIPWRIIGTTEQRNVERSRDLARDSYAPHKSTFPTTLT